MHDNIRGWSCLFLSSNQWTVIPILFSPDALTSPITLFMKSDGLEAEGSKQVWWAENRSILIDISAE